MMVSKEGEDVGQPIVDVAMGLVFFYVTLSLVCSSIQEIIASLLGLRSRNLKKGIRNLIGNEYAEAVYDHPLIKGLRKPKKLPSYIKPDIFSTALIDMISRDKTDENAIETAAEDVRTLIAKIDANNPTRELLISLVDKTKPTVDDLRERLADWFDAGMDRVAGWYKRQVKYCLIGVAAFVTVAVNADSIRMVEQLWQDDALRAAIASAAEQAATNGDPAEVDERTALRAFPIGYPDSFPGITLQTIVGWLVTMAAISLGAPFWFDLLSKISHLRASGTREADRAKNRG